MADYDFLDPAPPPEPPLKAVKVKPSERPPSIDPSREFILLTPTAQRASFAFSGHDFAGAILRAAAPLRGGEHALLWDGCARFTAEGIETTEAQHGTRARGCREFVIRKGRSHHCRIEGFINGGCHDGLLEDCDSWENGTGHMGHGFYLAGYGSTNIVGRRLRAWKCRGTAWQANGTPDELGPRKQRNIRLEDSQAWECGSQGTPALNVMSTNEFTARNVLIRDCNAGIALFDDYSAGADPWNVTLERLTLYLPAGKYGLQVSRGSRNVKVRASILTCDPGPVLQGRPTVDAETLRGTPEQALVSRWLDAASLKSNVEGVGWQGSMSPV